MSFVNWMEMNMIVDISFVVFLIIVVWKFRKNNSELLDIRTKLEMHRLALVELMEKAENNKVHTGELREQIISLTKNPQAARRKLKQEE